MKTLTYILKNLKTIAQIPVSSESTFPVLIPGWATPQCDVDDDEENGDGRADPDAGVEGGVVGEKTRLKSNKCVDRELIYIYTSTVQIPNLVLKT